MIQAEANKRSLQNQYLAQTPALSPKIAAKRRIDDAINKLSIQGLLKLSAIIKYVKSDLKKSSLTQEKKQRYESVIRKLTGEDLIDDIIIIATKKKTSKISLKFLNRNDISIKKTLKEIDAHLGKSGKQVGKSFDYSIKTMINSDGDCYEGEFEKGLPHGQGTLVYKNGDRYEGEFEKGLPHGQGTLVYKNGDRYEGEFEKGLPHGQGTLVYKNGDRYEGEFEKGLPHGQGKMRYANGNRYKGAFVAGYREGEGRMRYANGDCYEGAFVAGYREGQGTMHYANNDYYIGAFVNNYREGQGTLHYADGTRYTGEFRMDQRHGQGTLHYANGKCYVGEFRMNQRDGQGILTVDGDSFECEFYNGLLKGNLANFQDMLFLQPALSNTASSWPEYHLVILCEYFEDFLPRSDFTYKTIVNPMRSALTNMFSFTENPDGVVDKIFDNVINLNNEELISFNSKSHAMAVNLVPNPEGLNDCIRFEIFNSGGGLSKYHEYNSRTKKFQTMLQIDVPKDKVTKALIKRCCSTGNTTDEVYQMILEIGKKVEVPNPRWQRDQKGGTCALECWFAYLANKMPPLEYHEMRLAFFQKCLEMLGDREDLKEICLRKIEARKHKIAKLRENLMN